MFILFWLKLPLVFEFNNRSISGDPPSVEQPQGPYPFIVTREDGSQALVVQDFAFGKYMGHLEVQFDDDGKLTSWRGNPVLLDATVEEGTHSDDMNLAIFSINI